MLVDIVPDFSIHEVHEIIGIGDQDARKVCRADVGYRDRRVVVQHPHDFYFSDHNIVFIGQNVCIGRWADFQTVLLPSSRVKAYALLYQPSVNSEMLRIMVSLPKAAFVSIPIVSGDRWTLVLLSNVSSAEKKLILRHCTPGYAEFYRQSLRYLGLYKNKS